MDEIMMALDMLAEEERIRKLTSGEKTKKEIDDDTPALIFCNQNTKDDILKEASNTREYINLEDSIIMVPFMDDGHVIVTAEDDFMEWLAGSIEEWKMNIVKAIMILILGIVGPWALAFLAGDYFKN